MNGQNVTCGTKQFCYIDKNYRYLGAPRKSFYLEKKQGNQFQKTPIFPGMIREIFKHIFI